MESNSSEYSHILSCKQEETIKASDVLFSGYKWMETSIPETWSFVFSIRILIFMKSDE